MKKEHTENKITIRDKVINIAILVSIYGWLIYSNLFELMNINSSLYSFVIITSPFLLITIILSNKKRINRNNFFIMIIYTFIPVYLILLDNLNGNYDHRLSYNLSMGYIFIFINIIIFILAKKTDIDFHYKLLKKIVRIFIILSFISLINNGIEANRFLNSNFTSFLIAQFFIIFICESKRNLLDWIVFILGIIEILAAGGRASFIVLVFIFSLKYFKSVKKKILPIIIGVVFIIITFFILKNIYYNYLKINENFVYLSRPIGFIVGDKEVILDQSSNERIYILSEYLYKMSEKAPYSLIFGLGPKNFSEYSHNIIVDSISFGGIFTTLINFFVFFKNIKLKKFNECLFYQILFFFLIMMFTGTFITNIAYWGLVFLQQYKYNLNGKMRMNKEIYSK